jgi:hypothetical protein
MVAVFDGSGDVCALKITFARVSMLVVAFRDGGRGRGQNRCVCALVRTCVRVRMHVHVYIYHLFLQWT